MWLRLRSIPFRSRRVLGLIGGLWGRLRFVSYRQKRKVRRADLRDAHVGLRRLLGRVAL